MSFGSVTGGIPGSGLSGAAEAACDTATSPAFACR